MQSRTIGCWLRGVSAAAAWFFANGLHAQTPALPADKGAVSPAPARRALPADIFQPPPVPGFMLRTPEKPLTHEEMLREAEEAAARVRQPSQANTPSTPDSSSPAQLQKNAK